MQAEQIQIDKGTQDLIDKREQGMSWDYISLLLQNESGIVDQNQHDTFLGQSMTRYILHFRRSDNLLLCSHCTENPQIEEDVPATHLVSYLLLPSYEDEKDLPEEPEIIATCDEHTDFMIWDQNDGVTRILYCENLDEIPEIRPKPVKFCLSLGGGLNSIAMLFHIIDNKLKLDWVVFADTGSELPETYRWVEYIKQLCERMGIGFKRVRPKQWLIDKLKKRQVFPDKYNRWCTRDAKVTPIHKFYREELDCYIYEYMGIDYDEAAKRMTSAKEDYICKVYPLVENKIGRSGCENIMYSKNLPCPPKSGCPFCPFNTPERWRDIRDNYPGLFEEARQLERNSKHYPKKKLIVLQEDGSQETVCGESCGV